MDEGRYAAVLDRFEGESAVLLVEANGETVDELVVPTRLLPSAGRHENAVFAVTASDDRTELAYDAEETERRAEGAQNRFDRLSRSLSSADEGAEPSPALRGSLVRRGSAPRTTARRSVSSPFVIADDGEHGRTTDE